MKDKIWARERKQGIKTGEERYECMAAQRIHSHRGHTHTNTQMMPPSCRVMKSRGKYWGEKQNSPAAPKTGFIPFYLKQVLQLVGVGDVFRKVRLIQYTTVAVFLHKAAKRWWSHGIGPQFHLLSSKMCKILGICRTACNDCLQLNEAFKI